ncbi:uncharacterized protein LOC115889070 [Sitophilus oryzae]|uniref:Uncharacterized protein LOC115889070 n=1 Tax=Sitophilus oryzae TaxID=7048 RepID=A0A6J2YPY4_SITOR|nr:uncharacterized protein LOC115889070 [Sitophilus oryzae]
MMSWDLVFWANKEAVDYIPSSWALDEVTYKWPLGVSQEVRQGLIDTCDPLKNIKYRTSRGIARKKGITDLQNAKTLCERALYTSSVDTTTDAETPQNLDNDSSDDQNVEPPEKTVRFSIFRKSRETPPAFTPPIATKSLGSENTTDSPKSQNTGLSKLSYNSVNSQRNSSDDDDLPLKELVVPSTSSNFHVTAEGPDDFTPSKRKSLFQENLNIKKYKVRCMAESPSVLNNGQRELDTSPFEPSVALTVSERLMLKEIKKLNWEIQDMKKTVNKIQDLLLTNNMINIESSSEEPFQLPIKNQALLESIEQHLEDEKNIELLAQRLYLCGGDNTHKSVFLLMKKLFSRDLAMLYSGSGKKGKLSFQKLSCYKAVIKAVRKRFPGATDADINKSISLYLAGAADREGGRKNRDAQ